jgi:hypothetical protein
MSSRVTWFLVITAVIVLADELAYYWWKQLHPGVVWHGVFGKNQLQTWEGELQNSFPNGFRPGGGLA